jgi:hypothetical protein
LLGAEVARRALNLRAIRPFVDGEHQDAATDGLPQTH